METTLQRTPEWFSARLGKLTGSRAREAFDVYSSGKDKGKPKECAIKLARELASERLNGHGYEQMSCRAMQWGVMHEDEARQAYEDYTGSEVRQVGFIDHPEINNFGASPDGLVGADGCIEIKCPSEATHNDRLHLTEAPEEYRAQMMVEMLCTGRKWCDFVDYDPRNDSIPLIIIRYQPSEKERKETEEKAITFLKMVDEEEAFQRNLMEQINAKRHKEIWDALDEDEIKE